MSVHRVPAIERMADILSRLEQADGCLGVKELAASCGVPRSTVYCILNLTASQCEAPMRLRTGIAAGGVGGSGRQRDRAAAPGGEKLGLAPASR